MAYYLNNNYPSAPPMDQTEINNPVYNDLYPKLAPNVQSSHFYSQFQPIKLCSQPTCLIPYWTKEQEIANQAYLNIWRDLKVVQDLPDLNLDNKSIQTLKQIVARSNQGLVNNLLTLMIKVIQLVGKLALGFIVGSSIALVASALLNLPIATIFFSLFFASPAMKGCLLVGLTCKIAAYALRQLKKSYVEHSFCSAIKEDKQLLKHLQNLKSWMHIECLSDIEARMQETMTKFQTAHKTMSYVSVQSQQELYLQSLLSKVSKFFNIENKLDVQFFMPLLNRFWQQEA